ncbi:MAG TPA: transcriptional regulator [Azospirillum sp.]
MLRVLLLIGLLWPFGLFVTPATAAELLMFEQAGCAWCARWHREVGPSYPLTAEGRAAPLRRVDLRAARPDDIKAIEGVVHTPTFVLVEDGREVGRILGYPGDAFFWGQLGELVARLPGRPS